MAGQGSKLVPSICIICLSIELPQLPQLTMRAMPTKWVHLSQKHIQEQLSKPGFGCTLKKDGLRRPYARSADASAANRRRQTLGDAQKPATMPLMGPAWMWGHKNRAKSWLISFFSFMIVEYCYNSVHYLFLCDEHVAILMIYTGISSAVGQLI